MELKEIAVVSGKPGLFRIIKPAVNGVILEALDGTSARFIASSSTKVSVLGEISVYTEDGDNIPLLDVFKAIFEKHGKDLKYGSKSSEAELRSFFTEVVPNHDKQKVYNSDIKKIASWYLLLVASGMDFAASEPKEEKEAVEEPKKEKKSKKETTPPVAEEAKEPLKKEGKAPAAKKEKESTVETGEAKEKKTSAKSAGTKKAAK